MQELTPPEALTPEQVRVMELLAAGKPVTIAAKEVGIDPSTIHRWRQSNEMFNLAWEQLLAHLWMSLKAELKAAGALALRTLCDVMMAVEASHKDKIAAAQTILMNLHKIVTDDELRKRVEALVLALEAQHGDAPVN